MTPFEEKVKDDLRKTGELSEEVLDSDICELQFPSRIYNLLKRARINTVKDLLKRSGNDLCKIPSCGAGTYKTIAEKISELGYKAPQFGEEMVSQKNTTKVKMEIRSMQFTDLSFKYILVDFDSTLWLWNNTAAACHGLCRENMDILQLTDMLHDPDTVYDTVYNPSQINTLLIEYLKEQKEKGARIILVSWVEFSFNARAKFNFINEHTDNLLDEYVGTMGKESKITLADTLYSFSEADKQDILIIDDAHEVIKAAKEAGYSCQEPQFIMNEMYRKDR